MNIYNRLIEIVRIINLPISIAYNYFFVFVAILLLSGGVYNCTYSATISNGIMWTLVQFPIYVTIAYAFTFIYYLLLKLQYKVLRILAYSLIAFYLLIALIECYLLVTFKSYITPTIITFLLQTTIDEVKGFLHAFVLTQDFFLYALVLLAIISTVWFIIRYLLNRIYSSLWIKSIVLFSLLFALGIFIFSPLRNKVLEKFPFTSVSRLVCSIHNYNQIISSDREICTDAGVLHVDVKSPCVVVVIGESCSKYHSSLYSYKKDTNPILRRCLNSTNLFLFNDVVSPYNKTNSMLKELFSMHSVDCTYAWNEYPLWCNILKQGGFYVSFVSNQVTAIGDDYCGDSGGSYFFQYPDVVKRSFDYRNYDLYKYDEGLLGELDLIASKVDSCELTVLQLKGQHIYAKYNFPHDQFTKFTIEDYRAEKNFLNDSQMQEIADYDNATLYNDYVVSEIIKKYQDKDAILIYLSDHGEEVHDYRAFLGRSHNSIPNEYEVKYQYEIPFMIYVSDLYKKNHPEIVDRIKESVNLPFMSDDLSHLILGLSGIKTKWYDPTRDLLHENYNRERQRIVSDNVLYKSN